LERQEKVGVSAQKAIREAFGQLPSLIETIGPTAKKFK